jgi:hypothetical protein
MFQSVLQRTLPISGDTPLSHSPSSFLLHICPCTGLYNTNGHLSSIIASFSASFSQEKRLSCSVLSRGSRPTRPPRPTSLTRLTGLTRMTQKCVGVSVRRLIFGRIPAASAHSPEKKSGKSFAGTLERGLPCIIAARRPPKTLVNLSCLLYVASAVQLLDISVFMCYNIGRGQEL